jgi:hypothetical protein
MTCKVEEVHSMLNYLVQPPSIPKWDGEENRAYIQTIRYFDYILNILSTLPDSSIQKLHAFLYGVEKDPPQPAAWYKHIEEWFGEPFDEKLAYRIANMPEEQKVAYIHSFPLVDWSLPEIQRGNLRPVFATRPGEPMDFRRLGLALRLLMYSHEVVLDAADFARLFGSPDFADTFRTLGSEDYVSYYERDIGPSSFEDLKKAIQIRPLVENGTIKFSQVYRDGSYYTAMQRAQFQDLVQIPEIRRFMIEFLRQFRRHDQVFRDEELALFLEVLCNGVSATCQLASNHRAHVLARSQLEEEVMRGLLQSRITDNRQILLKNLAALEVPAMDGDISSLVRLRESEASFADWRTHLGDALKYVGELGDEDASIKEASDVVSAELKDGLAQITKAAKKSPAITAVKGGLTGLAITGVTAGTTGLITGSPWVGLASGAAGKVADGVVTYVKALKEQRKHRLLLDVAMYFHDTSDPRDAT